MGQRIPTGALALITALVAMGVASMALYMPSLPAIRDEFRVPNADVQFTLTVFFIGFSVGQLIAGPLSDRFGRRPVLIVGLVLYAFASLACAFAWQIEALQISRLFQGAMACVGPVVGRAIIRDRTDGGASAASAFSVVGTALAIVPAVAPTIGGLIQSSIGWRASFVLLCLLSLVLLLLCLRDLEESIPEKKQDALQLGRLMRTYAGLLGTPYFLGNVLVSTLAFAGFFAYFTMSPFLFIEQMGFSPEVYGVLMLFTVIGYAAGNVAAGRLIGRVSNRSIALLACGFLISGAVLVFLFSGELTAARLIAPMMVYTVGFGMAIPVSMAEALRPFPRIAGSASAVLGFLQFFCAALASKLAQLIQDGTTVPLSFALMGLALGALVSFLVLTRNGPIGEQ